MAQDLDVMTVIEIDPDSELARALERMDSRRVVLESKGVRYTVTRREKDPWENYDPAKVRAGLRRFAGIISREEAERMKELVYRGREEGTRPPDRP